MSLQTTAENSQECNCHWVLMAISAQIGNIESLTVYCS